MNLSFGWHPEQRITYEIVIFMILFIRSVSQTTFSVFQQITKIIASKKATLHASI